jgi:GT2 family glycosyltransferase
LVEPCRDCHRSILPGNAWADAGLGTNILWEKQSGLEPACESRPSQDPVELYSQECSPEVWLLNYTVKVQGAGKLAKTVSIASVTVATNAGHMLPRQIEALQRQSKPLEEIIVVDNASTDNTQQVLSAKYPQVTVLSLSANLGVGGGFSAGLAYAAIQKKHDWVWLLDDDSVPKFDAIETLLRGLESVKGASDDIGILAPLPVHPGSGQLYPGLLWRRGWVQPSPELLCQPVCFVDAVISSGSLVRREAVENVGLPRQDFFMDFVDFEYCLRMRRQGLKVALVCGSVLDHAIGDPRAVTFLGFARTWNDHAPWREYYFVRNQTFTIWNFYPDWKSRFYVLRTTIRHAAGTLLFGRRKFACLQMMLFGFQDGRSGRLGIRFSPDGQETGSPSPTTGCSESSG